MDQMKGSQSNVEHIASPKTCANSHESCEPGWDMTPISLSANKIKAITVFKALYSTESQLLRSESTTSSQSTRLFINKPVELKIAFAD